MNTKAQLDTIREYGTEIDATKSRQTSRPIVTKVYSKKFPDRVITK
jgi:hypothetical protein